MQKKNILIVGAGHGIGLSLVKKILQSFEEPCVFATYRVKEKAEELLDLDDKNLIKYQVDPSEDNDLIFLKKSISDKTCSLDLVILCMGVLDSENSFAEKKIDDIFIDKMIYSFKVNAISHALVVKNIKSFLRGKNTSTLVHLSAKVGSIEENQLGGWYSYRMSKASLNMFVKNIDIEFKRSNFNCNVFSVHPGTTSTLLSEKYLRSVKYKIYSSDETASHIIDLCDSLGSEHSGKFFHWDGTEICW